MFPVQLTTKDIPLADDVKRIVDAKMKKLQARLKKFPEDAVKAVVMLKRRKRQSEDDIYVSAIALYVPSKILHARKDGYTLEESFNEAVDDIEDQLEELKSKIRE